MHSDMTGKLESLSRVFFNFIFDVVNVCLMSFILNCTLRPARGISGPLEQTRNTTCPKEPMSKLDACWSH